MQTGISVYAGLDYSIQENISLIEKAASLGMKKIFTSAQIPETDDSEKFLDDFSMIMAVGMSNNLEIIIDVNRENISDFNIDGVTLRLDDGFSISEIVDLSRARKIILNASTVPKSFLITLENSGADFENISALHNFYPHLYTALDTDFFIAQNENFHEFGISVGAFAASLNGRRRAPLYEGLPTLEESRNFSTDLSARFLAALDTDFIIVGDGLPTDEELENVAAISDNEIIMQAKLSSANLVSAEMLNYVFTCRPDISKYAIRAVEGRQILKLSGGIIEAENSVERNFGDITIDNKNFGRYAGEVQVVKNFMPADSRVNVVASILDEEKFLIRYIEPHKKFSFRLV